MREMVLNHASIPASDNSNLVVWLKDLAGGMGLLVASKVSNSSLRICKTGYNRYADVTGSALDSLRLSGAREEFRFIARLTTKTPLLDEVDEAINDRFLACETIALSGDDGSPLVLCAITDWIAIGFPTASVWDRDRIEIHFNEMFSDGTIEKTTEYIDNLTRSAHAGPIVSRHRERLRAVDNPEILWKNREQAFPCLIFGPGVEENLNEIQSQQFHTVVNKLVALNQTAMIWRDVAGVEPPWGTKVTPETKRVINNDNLREARMFMSHDGTRKLYEWHARFGNAGRIHLRFDRDTLEIEVGYIGQHLPL